MRRSEYREIRDAFHRKYATKRKWPLRVESICVQPTAPEPLRKKYNLDDEIMRMGQNFRPEIHKLKVVMKLAMSKGSFGFLFDRVGSHLMVVDTQDADVADLTLGSIVVAIDDKKLEVTDVVQAELQNPKEKSLERRKEAARQQMIKIITDNGISPSQTIPFRLCVVNAPRKHGYVHKIHPRSKYSRRTNVLLCLRNGLINYYSNIEGMEKDSTNNRGVNVRTMKVEYTEYIDAHESNHYILLNDGQNKWTFEFQSTSDWYSWLNTIQFSIRFAHGDIGQLL